METTVTFTVATADYRRAKGGLAPWQVRRLGRRMQRAKGLLLSTAGPIVKIAANCGQRAKVMSVNRSSRGAHDGGLARSLHENSDIGGVSR
jgi:hypothetical protein